MARSFECTIFGSAFMPDTNAQLVAGDGPAGMKRHNDGTSWAFDDTSPEAIVSQRFAWPSTYAGGAKVLKARLAFKMETDNTGDVKLEVYLEAFSAGDNFDLETATNWDSANTPAGATSVVATAAGNLLTETIDITNKQSVAVADAVRLGVRRNAGHVDDDADDDLFFEYLELWEE